MTLRERDSQPAKVKAQTVGLSNTETQYAEYRIVCMKQ